MCGGASAAGRVKVYFKSPIAVRRSEFRYAKRARQTFMCGGASAAGRVKICLILTLSSSPQRCKIYTKEGKDAASYLSQFALNPGRGHGKKEETDEKILLGKGYGSPGGGDPHKRLYTGRGGQPL
jgi:hypothetical protein